MQRASNYIYVKLWYVFTHSCRCLNGCAIKLAWDMRHVISYKNKQTVHPCLNGYQSMFENGSQKLNWSLYHWTQNVMKSSATNVLYSIAGLFIWSFPALAPHGNVCLLPKSPHDLYYRHIKAALVFLRSHAAGTPCWLPPFIVTYTTDARGNTWWKAITQMI